MIEIKYRPEIDGLRAVAILPVILFHAGLPFFKGGFVGVDVFFVISGFLITSIILSELRNNRFSVLQFYERRARRILPALFVVMLVSSVAGYFWLLPDEFENFGQSLLATALSANNVLLALTTGYWDLAAEFKPLLHTWSLGVEEQYYVIFPVIAFLLWRSARNGFGLAVGVMAIVSLAAAQWAVNHYPVGNFYGLPTRAWELFAGSLCAIYLPALFSRQVNKNAKQALGIVGLGLIAVSIITFSGNTPNPSFYTVLPVLGTVLIILFADPDTLVNKMLSHPGTVAIGLISYSAYLWHNPIFTFARVISKEKPAGLEMAALVPVIFLLAYLTWEFVEKPFRDRRWLRRNTIFALAAAGVVVASVVGLQLHRGNGMPSRFYGDEVAAGGSLHISYNERVFEYKKDTFASNLPGQKKLLVLGQSFARDIVNALHEQFGRDAANLVYRDDSSPCLKSFPSPLNTLFADSEVVIYAFDYLPDQCVAENIAEAKAQGKSIFYFGSKDFGINLNWLAWLPHDQWSSQQNNLTPQIIETERQFKALVPAENYISVLDGLSGDGRISITDEQGRLLSVDRRHVTRYGAIAIGKKVLKSSALAKLMQGN